MAPRKPEAGGYVTFETSKNQVVEAKSGRPYQYRAGAQESALEFLVEFRECAAQLRQT